MRRTTPNARLIWSGSSEAYGNAFNTNKGPVTESAALEPMSPYGATKAAADIMLRQMAEDGFETIVFRPFNHTGPGQTPDYVVPAFAEQVARIEAGCRSRFSTSAIWKHTAISSMCRMLRRPICWQLPPPSPRAAATTSRQASR